MKTYTPRRAVSACLLLAAIVLPAALPARAAAAGCPTQSTAQRFLRWGDPGWYAPLPDSGFETGGAWTLVGGATVIAGNEPYFIGSPTDSHSLALPTGAGAGSAPVCLWIGSPTLRLMIRNQGYPTARLGVAAVLTDPFGARRTILLGMLLGSSRWMPSPPIPILANTTAVLEPEAVSFRFRPADDLGRWTIDDVYVDPYGKG